MPVLNVTTRDGRTMAVAADTGLSVMEIIRDAGFDELLAQCGGCCSCATCHVYVHPDDLGRVEPIGEDEDDLLEGSSFRRPESRLSCQLRFAAELDGVRVTIAPED